MIRARRRTLLDRAAGCALPALILAGVVIGTWVALDLIIWFLTALGVADMWSLLVAAVTVSAVFGWVAGRLEE